MGLSLGIHIGHHSSCALVRDGVLLGAIQTERLSRTKHHPIDSLSNALPIREVLEIGGVGIDDIDVIISSFQGIGPGGFGLHQPLIEPNFSHFDPWDRRHRVLSHHLAHAHSTYESSAFSDAAVLICDYAGSPTLDGHDYAQSFVSWYSELTQLRRGIAPKVECMSLYRADRSGSYRLLDRLYNEAHPGQGSFVYSIAGLYENVAQYVFRQSNAYGQLMALAAYGERFAGMDFDPGPLVETLGQEDVTYRNDWQHKLPVAPDFELKCCLAWRCQQATETALLAAARKAVRLSDSRNLAVAGGVFLNILANTHLIQSGVCSAFYVNSAPHDAGISVGCAFHGSRLLGSASRAVTTDRLGKCRSAQDVRDAVRKVSGFVEARPFGESELMEGLAEGRIVARCSGRAEFGPRALGARSLLGSPLLASTKVRLNRIKDRAEWRPVAPIVPREDAARFFEGPDESYWMTLSQRIREEYRVSLPALSHPDGSTRAQTILPCQDEELYTWLKRFEKRSGYPILVNTSFNRRGEPIVETASDALATYLDREDIDWLILDDLLVTRVDPLVRLADYPVRLSPAAVLTQHFAKGECIMALTDGERTWRVSEVMYEILVKLGGQEEFLGDVLCELTIAGSEPSLLRSLLLHDVLVREQGSNR
jgi:carbamoyltransferase